MGIMFQRQRKRQVLYEEFERYQWKDCICIRGKDTETFLRWRCENILDESPYRIDLRRDFLSDAEVVDISEIYRMKLKEIVVCLLEKRLTQLSAHTIIDMVGLDADRIICFLKVKRIQELRIWLDQEIEKNKAAMEKEFETRIEKIKSLRK